jgi:hypothetical protein
MTELETIKVILSYAPNIAIAIGVAKIYLKLVRCFESMEERISQNSEDIGKLIDIHIDRHEEDAKDLLRRKKNG